METVQQNGRFTLFPSKFHSNIYSILFGWWGRGEGKKAKKKFTLKTLRSYFTSIFYSFEGGEA